MTKFARTITEDMEGELLAEVLVDHWHAGAGSTLFADEMIHAARAARVSTDRILDVIESVNDYRGHDLDADTLAHAFVPEENRQAVRDLLDQIVAMCVSM